MKKIIFSLLILISSTCFLYSNPLDSSVNFPLHVGDFYTYRNVRVSLPKDSFGYKYFYTKDTVYYQAKVIDTISKSGKKYFVCKNFPLAGSIYSNCYLRYDSLKKCLLMYDSTSPTCNYEKKIYYLGTNNPDTSGFCLIYEQYYSFGNVTYFGIQTIYKSLQTYISGTVMVDFINYIAKNLGTYYMFYRWVYAHGGYAEGDYYHFLIGAKINGIIYGDTTLPIVGINHFYSNIIDKFELKQNYPNPFNPTTSIKFQVASSKFIRLAVFDILGKEVAILVNERSKVGEYETTFDGSGLPSGVYFYSLYADGVRIDTKKMLMIK